MPPIPAASCAPPMAARRGTRLTPIARRMATGPPTGSTSRPATASTSTPSTRVTCSSVTPTSACGPAIPGAPVGPLYRALTPTPEERLIRELVLQFKLGRISRAYFQHKFGVDILARFAEPVARLKSQGLLTIEGDWLRLSRDGLLEVDRLVHEFFLPEHRTARYA